MDCLARRQKGEKKEKKKLKPMSAAMMNDIYTI